MREFLITGGAGFIGANFVHYLLETFPEDRVTVLDKLTYAGNLENLADLKDDPRFEFIRADLVDAKAVREIVQGKSYTHIAHLAAESHVDRSISGPGEFIHTNVLGTFHLLEAVRELGWSRDSGKVFLHISTDEVFGSLGPEGKFTETTPYDPRSPYSASKAASDHLVQAYFHTYGVPTLTSNCSNNYGPYQYPEKLIPLVIINCLNGKEIPVYGKGENVRDWLYVKDHCSALERIIARGAPGQSYNVGGENEWRNIDIIHKICEILDSEHPEGAPHADLIRFVQDRPGHDKRYAIDARKISDELDWRPQHKFEEAILETIRWFLANRDWWGRILDGSYRDYYERQYAK